MHQIFWKILLSFWIALLITGLGTGAAVTLYQEAKSIYRPVDLDERADSFTEPMAKTLQAGGTSLLKEITHIEQKPPVNTQNKNGMAPPGPPVPFVVDESGKDLFNRSVDQKAFNEAKMVTEKKNNQVGVEKVTAPTGETYWIFLQRRPPPFPFNVLFSAFEVPVLPLIILLMVSLLFSGWLARSISKPIETLRDSIRAVSRGDFDIDVSAKLGHRYDEFADLGHDTDSMAEQLKQHIESQRRLLHDISHDLRSPLARLQLAIGLLRQKPESMEQMLQRIEQECHRLDSLVGEVLTLARMESGVPQPREDYIDLIELMKSLVDDATFESKDNGSEIILQLDEHLPEGIIIQSRGELLLRAFDNLIRNALKHAGRGCRIDISIHQKSPEQLTIDIADNGPGVAENDLDSIFRPFYRSNNNPGEGLGLAITKRAIEAHGGTIYASNRPSGGLCMHVLLPCSVQLS